MKKYNATIRRPDGKEYEYTVNATSKTEAFKTICHQGLPNGRRITKIRESK